MSTTREHGAAELLADMAALARDLHTYGEDSRIRKRDLIQRYDAYLAQQGSGEGGVGEPVIFVESSGLDCVLHAGASMLTAYTPRNATKTASRSPLTPLYAAAPSPVAPVVEKDAGDFTEDAADVLDRFFWRLSPDAKGKHSVDDLSVKAVIRLCEKILGAPVRAAGAEPHPTVGPDEIDEHCAGYQA